VPDSTPGDQQRVITEERATGGEVIVARAVALRVYGSELDCLIRFDVEGDALGGPREVADHGDHEGCLREMTLGMAANASAGTDKDSGSGALANHFDVKRS
jgi:hypothetical protein